MGGRCVSHVSGRGNDPSEYPDQDRSLETRVLTCDEGPPPSPFGNASPGETEKGPNTEGPVGTKGLPRRRSTVVVALERKDLLVDLLSCGLYIVLFIWKRHISEPLNPKLNKGFIFVRSDRSDKLSDHNFTPTTILSLAFVRHTRVVTRRPLSLRTVYGLSTVGHNPPPFYKTFSRQGDLHRLPVLPERRDPFLQPLCCVSYPRH